MWPASLKKHNSYQTAAFTTAWGMCKTSISLNTHWQFYYSCVTPTSWLWYIARTIHLQEGMCVCVWPCVLCVYLVETFIHFSVKVSLALLFSLFLVLFFVLVFLFQALLPHTHGTRQHRAQSHDAEGSNSPWWHCKLHARAHTHTHTRTHTHKWQIIHLHKHLVSHNVQNVSLKCTFIIKLFSPIS